MPTEFDLNAKLREIGIIDPAHLSATDVKMLLDAMLKQRSLDVEAFKIAMTNGSATVAALCAALKVFATEQGKTSAETLRVIRQGIDLLNDELARGDLSVEERAGIRTQVIDLIAEARKEAQENRTWVGGLAVLAGGVAVVAVGAGVYAYTRGGNKDLLIAGAKMAGSVLK